MNCLYHCASSHAQSHDKFKRDWLAEVCIAERETAVDTINAFVLGVLQLHSSYTRAVTAAF